MVKLMGAVGAGLVAVGVVAYLATSMSSVTSLIPAFVGVALLIASLIGLGGEGRRKHAVHAGLLVALLAAAGSIPNVIQIGDAVSGSAERPGAVWASLAMLTLLLIFIVAGVRSFIRARVARKQVEAQ